jgi:hypothetical protein
MDSFVLYICIILGAVFGFLLSYGVNAHNKRVYETHLAKCPYCNYIWMTRGAHTISNPPSTCPNCRKNLGGKNIYFTSSQIKINSNKMNINESPRGAIRCQFGVVKYNDDCKLINCEIKENCPYR